jgi:uncharacterized protein (DUF362 family)
MMGISRRNFLRFVGAGSLGFLAKPLFPFASRDRGPRQSDVVQCYDDNATTGGSINEPVVQIMMDESIKALTGMSDVGEAWKSIFPGITESSIIGIKVNCLFQITTKPGLVDCIINGLTQMDFSGNPFIANNIIIWDNQDNLLVNNGGYTIYDGNDPNTPRCFGTDHSGVGYDTNTPFSVNGVTSYPSRIMTLLCDYLIDAAVIKDHSISQITLTMKNNYGSVNNPGSLHGGQCNPYIPSLNQQIRDVIVPNDKQKLFVVDALFGCYSGGPGGSPNFNPKMVLMSIDPVAIDYHGQSLINDERANHSLPPYDAPHITTAELPPYNLGTTHVNLIEIINPSGVEESAVSAPERTGMRVSPNPFRTGATIWLFLAHPTQVKVDMTDASGRIVENIYEGFLAKGRHRIRKANRRHPAGTYFVHMHSYGKKLTEKVVIVQ